MSSGILISSQDFSSISDEAQTEILAAIGVVVAAPGRIPNQIGCDALSVDAEDENGPPDFTVAMARRLVADPISPKTIAVLKVIAEGASPEFHLKDAVASVEGAETYRDISNVWSGITRRARNILNDGEADFIWWDGEKTLEGDLYVDHIGRVSEMTHRSLAKALKGK